MATVRDTYATDFESQREQYAASGPAGLTYEQNTLPELGSDAVIDCLLWRDTNGLVLGILNYYPHDIPPYERAGNLNLWVDPQHQRKGIGTLLLAEADRLWLIDFDAQDYTQAGLLLAAAYEQRHQRPSGHRGPTQGR